MFLKDCSSFLVVAFGLYHQNLTFQAVAVEVPCFDGGATTACEPVKGNVVNLPTVSTNLAAC